MERHHIISLAIIASVLVVFVTASAVLAVATSSAARAVGGAPGSVRIRAPQRWPGQPSLCVGSDDGSVLHVQSCDAADQWVIRDTRSDGSLDLELRNTGARNPTLSLSLVAAPVDGGVVLGAPGRERGVATLVQRGDGSDAPPSSVIAWQAPSEGARALQTFYVE